MKIGTFETSQFTPDQKLSEVEKELEFRWRAYRRLVTNGKMKQTDMDKRIAIMIAIRDDLRIVVDSIFAVSEGKLL